MPLNVLYGGFLLYAGNIIRAGNDVTWNADKMQMIICKIILHRQVHGAHMYICSRYFVSLEASLIYPYVP